MTRNLGGLYKHRIFWSRRPPWPNDFVHNPTLALVGSFDESRWASKPMFPSPIGEEIAAAVSASFYVPLGEKRTVAFSRAWDIPQFEFMKEASYDRRYARLYGTSGSAASVPAHDALLGSQGCRALLDSNFNSEDGAVSTKSSDLAYKSLHAGAVGCKREGHKDRELKSLQHGWCQQQPRILPSVTTGLSGIFNVNSKRQDKIRKDFMIVPKETTRGFAKTVAIPSQMQKPMKLRLYMGSPGIIGEPYKKPPPPLPFLRRWFTREGWNRRKQTFMGMIKNSYTVAKLRQKTKGYSQQRFYQEASDLYKQINVALAEGERTALRQLVTDSVFSVMKNELKHRENSWAKVKWDMVGPISKIRTLQGRLIGVDKNNQDNAFVQLTLRILSKQKFAAYDKTGKLVAGDPDKELLVEDYWVFEKPLLLTEAKWRLCGRLSI